ncbi:hypothetical protein CCR97_04315 [Rhodoplanes elegans]|uniref:Uncharacterized protein n=1 Tax=Rhodoplanes elegans TaxID=29408 RepID=A0A327K165_9BRAD|nr:DUF3486 family protein [Rhodoplanes elegans]MBK5957434.1 hypothetical protein [Rhodoplanes elegans]RAI31022.1 hypothetical protein CH338_26590 [Rhodoplanes elegans]
MTRPVSTDRPSPDKASAGKRGQLCSVELLPTAADAAVDAAADAVLARKRTQQDILLDLNLAVVAIGAKTIAPSSFNRWATRIRRDGYVRRSGAVPALKTVTFRCPHCGGDVSGVVETSARGTP